MNCHVYLSASMEKINQDITVSSILKQINKKIPPNNRFFLKKLKLQITARNYTFEKFKEKSYPYVHTLCLAYKECKRLL